MNTDTTFSSGIYQHYKGDYYLALFLVEHHDTRTKLVVYFSLEKKTLNVRPLCGSTGDEDAWNDIVELPDGGALPRFYRAHIDTMLLERAYTDAFRALQESSCTNKDDRLNPPPAFVSVITSRILGYVGNVIRSSLG